MGQEPGAYAVVGQPIAAQYTAIALPVAETGLQQAIAGALDSLIADGTYRSLLDKWQLSGHGGDEGDSQRRPVNGAQLDGSRCPRQYPAAPRQYGAAGAALSLARRLWRGHVPLLRRGRRNRLDPARMRGTQSGSSP